MSSVSSSGTPQQPDFDLDAWVGQRLTQVERALEQWVTADAPQGLDHGAPAQLVEAMRYAVLDGGKRLRPLLVLAAHEAVQRDGQASASDVNAALRAACAVELIHAYSLVHDDMPCMDNDVLRRGKPTVHVQFGEASALLAGDALQALAFELLTPQDGSVAHATQAHLCAVLARAAGSAGMAGGQAIDLASVGLPLTESQLREMHELKTGALLQASVMMGACCGAPAVPIPRPGYPPPWAPRRRATRPCTTARPKASGCAVPKTSTTSTHGSASASLPWVSPMTCVGTSDPRAATRHVPPLRETSVSCLTNRGND